MFSSTAPRYDLLNTLLSMGLHHRWKKFTVDQANVKEGDTVIDIASGTMDIAIQLARKVGVEGKVVALDFNRQMLDVGEKKIKELKLDNIEGIQGNAMDLPFENNSFDGATVGFGVRNVTDLDKAIREMYRVIKPGSRAVILEFSTPPNWLWSKMYDLYSYAFVAPVGTLISQDKTKGYFYLPNSIRNFPKQEELKQKMAACGLEPVKYTNLLGGIVAVHIGCKPLKT
ncbi:MAG: bifunctional demethylmenaquinone methyltransferase/2-methoxy-6-polyprenyl-1,4-benzoquinol methylase UbiE [Actinobacteria bacterium]|nr:MAG: bifunctional demethylmenaquinone methyltransferase/2-methoxy-6-polyprenyl-1,4-benzoquinol methylase UbiE [Actinomycetota bacterium]